MSLNNISDEKSKEYTQYMLNHIKHIINEFGERTPGSLGENKAHNYLMDELKKYTDDVKIESFKVPPKAFMSFIPVAAILNILSFIFYWFLPIVSFFLTGISLLIVLFHFLLYKKVLDPFFPKSPSHNVLGTKKPSTGETKQTIIFGGHVDAVFEWRFSKINPKLLRIILIPTVLCIFVILIIDLLSSIFNFSWQGGYNNFWGILGIIQVIALPLFVLASFFVNYSVVSPGASDNLSGTLMAVALAKYLHEEGISFENTEVQFLLAGSEEAGLRGSKVYCKRHKNELLRSKAIFVCLESFCELEHLAINDKDMSGTVKNDPRVCLLLKNAGKNCGFEVEYQPVYIGATDAAAFSQAGVPAATLEAMDPGPPQWYHTRYDTFEHLEENSKSLEAAFKIVCETLRLFDEEGLPSEV